MTSVDEYVKMAEEAQQDNAHVAVLTNYRNAMDQTGYDSNAVPILVTALGYARKLKKKLDRESIAQWGRESLHSIKESLITLVNNEIMRLDGVGKELIVS
ncbi:MAG: hypothetical protein U9O94_05470 [Nanoarchaeota archaeon]|nr:hypothetical protein [Nanoarchaeota archaeon]